MTPVDSVAVATGFGAITSLEIIAGALLGIFAPLTHGVIARTTSIGAGLLLAAASVELSAEVLELSPYVGIVVLLIGAASFSLGNAWLSSQGALTFPPENGPRPGYAFWRPRGMGGLKPNHQPKHSRPLFHTHQSPDHLRLIVSSS